MKKSAPYVVGNWKMHGDVKLAATLTSAVVSIPVPGAEVVLCPPYVLIGAAHAATAATAVKLGGQDCHGEKEGAFTGDISAAMLRAAGCSYVIVGHSERRSHHKETSAMVRAKAAQAMESGLMPIICVGEIEDERQSGKALDVVGRQVLESLPKEAANRDFLLAYEPVWAIGSGKTPTTGDIAEMHTYIAKMVARATGLAEPSVHVLYGGSVKASNAAEILAVGGVSGVLVGGASLKAEEFCGIIAAAAALKKG